MAMSLQKPWNRKILILGIRFLKNLGNMVAELALRFYGFLHEGKWVFFDFILFSSFILLAEQHYFIGYTTKQKGM